MQAGSVGGCTDAQLTATAALRAALGLLAVLDMRAELGGRGGVKNRSSHRQRGKAKQSDTVACAAALHPESLCEDLAPTRSHICSGELSRNFCSPQPPLDQRRDQQGNQPDTPGRAQQAAEQQSADGDHSAIQAEIKAEAVIRG